MAEKHELMARLQAARQSAGRIVETENRKTYPDFETKSEAAAALVSDETASGSKVIPTLGALALQEEIITMVATPVPCAEAEKETGCRVEKVCYTTISVPKSYGHKAKLYATLLKVNIVDFTCGALDAYILQLQEAGKLPKLEV